MVSYGYWRIAINHCVYVRKSANGRIIILLLYEDDMVIVRHDSKMIGRLKEETSKTFDMKDLGHARQILDMCIHRSDRNAKKLWLLQEKYVERKLESST